MACLVSIHIVSTTGLNILTGYTGLVSLGQAAFMGVGAYTAGFLQIKVGSPFLINLLAAGFVTAGVGIIFGLPSLRIKGL
jgi:branched-chain amino acid transport system permease protein